MKPFDPTKPVQTRDGRKARILATDADCDDGSGTKQPIVATIEGDNQPRTWAADGRYLPYHSKENPRDLINTPEVHKLSGWVNLYNDGTSFFVYDSKHAADKGAAITRRACIDLSTVTCPHCKKTHAIVYTVGEGI